MSRGLSFTEVSADGPLSLRCTRCPAFLGGTAYPVTGWVLSDLVAKAEDHARTVHGVLPSDPEDGPP